VPSTRRASEAQIARPRRRSIDETLRADFNLVTEGCTNDAALPRHLSMLALQLGAWNVFPRRA
jgi:hypothetical protein